MTASPPTLLQHTYQWGEHTIQYFSAGKPAGITFVLVHGLGNSAASYTQLTQLLAQDFRVIAIDLPGFGASPKPAYAMSIKELAGAVYAVIAKEQLSYPILVGQSMGCQVVASLLARAPHLAAKAVLIGPTTEAKKRTVGSHLYKLLLDTLHEPLRVNRAVWRDYARCGIGQYMRALRAMLRDRTEENLAASEAAIMIVRGSQDRVAPRAWTSKLAAVSTLAGTCEIKGAPHLVHMTHPEEVADICSGFALS